MDDLRFDSLVRLLSVRTSRRQMLRGLVGGTASLVAIRASTVLAGPTAKVTICHKPGTPAEAEVTVAASAVRAHLAHGDRLGACVCIPDPLDCRGLCGTVHDSCGDPQICTDGCS